MMVTRLQLLRVLILAATVVVGVAPARASWQDLYGFGARSMALGGAVTASVDDYSAVYYNPAGLMLGRDFSAAIARVELFNNLKLNGRSFNTSSADVSGTLGGLQLRQRWFDRLHLGFGTGFFVPDQGVIKAEEISPNEPRAVLLHNRSQRVAINFAGAVEVFPNFYFGSGFSLFADLTGKGVDIDASLLTGKAEADVEIKIKQKIAPFFGAIWQPMDRLRVGASYRGEQDINLDIPTKANLGVDPGAPPPAGDLGIIATLGVSDSFFWTPLEVSGGVAVAVTDNLTLMADLTWYQWSHFPALSPEVILEASGVLAALLEIPGTTPPARVRMKDTLVPRFGVEYWWLDLPYIDLALRGGYAFFDSPVKSGDGNVAFLDSDRHLVTAGVEILLDDPWDLFLKPAAFNFSFQAIFYEPRTEHLRSPTGPIGDVRLSGQQFNFGAELILEF
ncbi:MAG: outer membrane protein transport protein [Myxococcales bacterium]|nr:outer membrane protein transport protein [Myxococcales bacterium]